MFRHLPMLALLIALPGCRGCDSESGVGPAAPESATQGDDPSTKGARPERTPRVVPLTPDAPASDDPILVVDRLRTATAKRLRISRGGRWIQSIDRDGVLQVFDGARGRLLLERPLLPERACRGTALTATGRRLLLRRGNRARLINLWTGQERARFEGDGRVRCSLSQDGTRVVIADRRRIRVYDAGNPAEPVQTIQTPIRAPREVHADERATVVLLSGPSESSDVAMAWGGSGGQRWRPLRGYGGQRGLVLSETGDKAAGPKGVLRTQIWDTFTGKSTVYDYRSTYSFSGHDSAILAGYEDGRLVIHPLGDDGEPRTVHTLARQATAALSDDGQRLAVVGGDRAAHRLALWSVADGSPRFQRSGAAEPVVGLAWGDRGLDLSTPSGSLRFDPATGSAAGRRRGQAGGERGDWHQATRWVGAWSARYQGREIVVSDPRGDSWDRSFGGRIASASFDRNGRRLAVLAGTNVVLFEVDGRVAAEWALEGHASGALIAHPGAAEIVVVRSTGELTGHAPQSGAISWRVAADRALQQPTIAMDRSGRRIVAGGGFRLVVYEHGEATTLLASHAIGARIRALAPSPDGKAVAVTDGVDVTTWSVDSGELRARIAMLPDANAAVIGPDAATVTKGARPWLRWRRGLDHVPRGSPEINALWADRAVGPVKL